MTLIVGIKCSDGIVLGADGATTLAALGQPTVRQETKKLEILREQIIVGVSGHVGLSQLQIRAIDEVWDSDKLHNKESHQIRKALRNALWKHTEPELQAAAIAQQVYGPTARSSATCLSLVAFPSKSEACLVQFDQQCANEEASIGLPFVAIGSGQHIADPFLAFLKKIFWKNNLPTLAQGRFAAVWTVRHAIEVHPGGVSDPIQIAVLEKKQGKWKAEILPEEELQEHYEVINLAEKSLEGFASSASESQDSLSPPISP